MTMEYRSGLREGLNVLSGKYKALDPLELARWQITEMQPLWEAWSEVWAVGSEEAIAEANDLINKCGEAIGAGAQRGQGRPMWLQALAGEKWTPEQLDQWQAEERTLAVPRKRFGEIARKELGVEAVNLFVSTELGVPPTGASQSADNKMP